MLPAAAPQPRSFGLDLVRCAAILMVLTSHCGTVFAAWYQAHLPWQVAVAGFYGVELFFILSGLLIGRLLIAILDRGPSWRDWRIFLVRRWMRTLPLYYLWLLVLAIAWPPRFWQPGPSALPHLLPWYLSLTQNLAWPMIDDSWFSVSWSLTIEEWFYLLFASFLFATARLAARFAMPGLALPATIAVFLAVPAALRWRLPDTVNWEHVTSAIVATRLDAIAFGVVIAWLDRRHPHLLRFRRTMLACGLCLLALLWTGRLDPLLGTPAHFRHTFIFDQTSAAFALCLPAFLAPTPTFGAFARIVRTLSGLSYAIYITHLSLLEWASYYRGNLSPTATMLATLTAILVLSYASYRFFETPILGYRPPQDSKVGGRAPPQTPALSRHATPPS